MKNVISICVLFICSLQISIAQEVNFIKIFNGKNLKGWEVPQDNVWWSVKNGVLFGKNDSEKKGSIIWTEKPYENFIFETDFLYGDGIIDTGIFLRTEKQQIQMGISGSLKRDMTGSPYIPGKGYPVEAEGVDEILRQNEWNTIKVKAQDNVYTVWINGKQVLSYESENVPEIGPIGLQVHPGNIMEVSFRNIRIAEIQ